MPDNPVADTITPEALNERIHRAAREITAVFDVSAPRGQRFNNTVTETIAIIIAQNLKGLHR